MKLRLSLLIISLLGLPAIAIAAPESSLRREALQQWQSNRFGMFIHWGPVSLSGQEISWSRANSNTNCPNNGPTPTNVYDNLYTNFNPTNFNASDCFAVARPTGMKYMVPTEKHADGCLL